MAMTYKRIALFCFISVIIISSVLSQDECGRPLQFTSKAVLDRYIRCLKAKSSPRYGKRMAPSVTGKLRPNWLSSTKPTDRYYSRLYKILQTFDN